MLYIIQTRLSDPSSLSSIYPMIQRQIAVLANVLEYKNNTKGIVDFSQLPQFSLPRKLSLQGFQVINLSILLLILLPLPDIRIVTIREEIED